MVFWDNIPGNSPGKLYAVMLADCHRSDPEAVGGRSDTVLDVLAVGPGICPALLETVGASEHGWG